MKTYCFIDASNLFYGGEKSLGWRIDYQKFFGYLNQKYGVDSVYYYGGVELDGFKYSVLDEKPVDLEKLLKFMQDKLKKPWLSDAQIIILGRHIQRVKFFRKLEKFGYKLILKPVKVYYDDEGNSTKKANCDVDMTFDMMRLRDEYDQLVVLTGDGDFAVILNYMQKIGKKLYVLARGERTAKEIRQLVGGNFRDFNYLREMIRQN